MNQAYKDLVLVDNTYDQQLELIVDGRTAFVQYELHQHFLALVHTEVPMALRGQGIGSALLEKVLHYSEERHLTIIPLCPFAASYIRQHPDWYRLVAPGYRPASMHTGGS